MKVIYTYYHLKTRDRASVRMHTRTAHSITLNCVMHGKQKETNELHMNVFIDDAMFGFSFKLVNFLCEFSCAVS